MSARLAGKVGIVTGAGSGIGAAAARRFASEGARVVCVDIDEDAARRLAETIGGVAIGADVASPTDMARMAAGAVESYGRIDVLYANAGIYGGGRVGDLSMQVWDSVIAVNLTGAMLSARAVVPHMVRQGGGALIFQSSTAGLVGFPNLAPYAASKGGIIALARQIAIDYAQDGVRANVLCPSTVRTRLVTERFAANGLDEAAGEEASARLHPLGRIGSPEEVAAAAAYLASDEAAWMTGAVIPLDGGLTAR
jgi:NAD(P)-dependent dehydrogenase (short-subunit alcohol dehydrogenase family)